MHFCADRCIHGWRRMFTHGGKESQTVNARSQNVKQAPQFGNNGHAVRPDERERLARGFQVANVSSMAALPSLLKKVSATPVQPSRRGNGTPPPQSRAHSAPRRGRGRPPGINPEREAALVEMARSGMTLAQMAAELGVSRQCVHQQLAKLPSVSTVRRVHRQFRQRTEAQQRRLEQALERHQKRSSLGASLARFLRDAMAQGWTVEAEPNHRATVNGVSLAFHMPRRTRSASVPSRSHHGAQYYHVQLTHPEWLNVVCLPTGRYLFYLPEANRYPGSCYIRATHAFAPQTWPEWPQPKERAKSQPSVPKKRRHSTSPAWAA